jgi:hypothetical protein
VRAGNRPSARRPEVKTGRLDRRDRSPRSALAPGTPPENPVAAPAEGQH